MTRARVVAGMAGIVTALLVQATVVGPVTSPLLISLPAVVVAVVALLDGPATGMAFGFAAGLTADLGSPHPAGVLALCWLGVGLLAGLIADRRSLVRDAITAGAVAASGSVGATLLLTVLGLGTAATALTQLLPTLLGDVAIAIAVVALLRPMLRTVSLRAPAPIRPDLVLERRPVGDRA